MAELDRSAQLDSAAKIIDLRHIENSLLIFPPSSPSPPQRNPNMCFSLQCFLFKVSPVSDVMMGILSGSLCKTIFLSLPRGLHTAYRSSWGQKCVRNYLWGERKKEKNQLWKMGVECSWNIAQLGGETHEWCPMGKWHKVLQDLKPSWETPWQSQVCAWSNTFFPTISSMRCFPILFFRVATIVKLMLQRSVASRYVSDLLSIPETSLVPLHLFYSYFICWTNVTATVIRNIWTWQLQILKGNYMCPDL